MAETARVGQLSIEVLRRAETARVAQVSVEALRNPGLTHLAQVSAEVLAGGQQTRLAQASVEVLWYDRPASGPSCEPLPDWIAYGATGGPEWGTALFSAPGGWEQRTQMFTQVRGRWDVSFLNVSREQATMLVDFFRAVAHGKASSFCFTDWRDHTFANVIGTGDGSTSAFQLVKVYTSGSLSYARPLSRVVLGSLVVTVNGVPTTHYAVEATSGQIQFGATPPAGAIIAASGAFEVLVRFETDSLQVMCVAPNVFSCAGLGLVELIGE